MKMKQLIFIQSMKCVILMWMFFGAVSMALPLVVILGCDWRFSYAEATRSLTMTKFNGFSLVQVALDRNLLYTSCHFDVASQLYKNK